MQARRRPRLHPLTHHRRIATIAIAAAAAIICLAAGAVGSRSARAASVLPPSAQLDNPPVVSGVAQEGQTLTTTNGGWNGTTPLTYSYEWQRCQVASSVDNPSFETDTSGWVDDAYAYNSPGGITMTRVTDEAHAGVASLRIDTPGARNEEGVRFGPFPASPGLDYRFVAFVYSAVAGPYVEIVGAIGGPSNPTYGEVSNRANVSLHTGWNRLSVRAMAPADASWATIWVETQSAAGGGKKQAITFYVDDVFVNGCSTIPGATSSSYPVVAADAGYRLSSVAIAQNSAGSASFGGTQTDEAVDKWALAPAYTGPVFADNTAAAAAEPAPPPPIITTLPTWRNLYDWPNGHGYVGWHFATSAPDSRYGSASNLGGNPGLWLWPVGGQRYTPNYAEWTYTAPGTTRLSTANLTFAYRNKLLAHHCIEIGFRMLDGTIIQEDKWCQPVLPPDSQRDVQVSLADPKNNPTAKVLFFRIELPPCNGGDPCEKWIPTLDPLTVGGYTRLEFADMILVDDDNPVVTASGSFAALAGQTIAGDQSYDLTISADDAGSGVTTIWLEQNDTQIASANATCDPTHHTPALDNRICPERLDLTTTIDTTTLPDDSYTYVGKAQDVAGNVGESTPWTVTIDRSGTGGEPASDEYDDFTESAGTADAPGGGEANYDPDSDPSLSCGAYADFGVSDWCGSGDPFGSAAQPEFSSMSSSSASTTSASTTYTGCGLQAVFWGINAMGQLISRLSQNNVGATCGQYYFAQEPGSNKMVPRCFNNDRAWPSNFHAAPVFHLDAWFEGYVKLGFGTWYQAGVQFRHDMVAQGCQPGDRWFLNELPRRWRSASFTADTRVKTRANVVAALKGLYAGGSDLPDVRGYTADTNMPHDTTGLLTYKSGLRQAYGAQPTGEKKDVPFFWAAVRKYVLGWSDETYTRCQQICLPTLSGETVASKRARIADTAVNPYTYHERFYAGVAPYTPVKTTLGGTYMPLLNAVWRSPLRTYGSLIHLDQFARIIRQQIFSSRRAAGLGYGSARIGFAWKGGGFLSADYTDAQASDLLAANLAQALAAAFGSGGTAAAACQPVQDGGPTEYGCPPKARHDIAVNDSWDTLFKVWP